MNLLVEKLKQLPQRKGEIWQGGLVHLPFWVKEEGQEPFRPWMAGWVSLRSKLVSIGEPKQDRDLESALVSLADFACDKQLAGYRPSGLDVKDPQVAEYLGGLLADAGIVVERRSKLHTFDEVLEDMLEAMKDTNKSPCMLENKKVRIEHVRDFAEAACEFFRAKPWQELLPEDLVEVESPVPDPGLKYFTVLGAAGEMTGLGFYFSVEEFDHFNRGGLPEDAGYTHWMISFDAMRDLPAGDCDLWEEHGLAVAEVGAYPFMANFASGGIRRPGPDVLAFAEGLLRVLARSTGGEMDSGRWTRTVETFDGPAEYTLSLHGFFDDDSAGMKKPGGIPGARDMEAAMANLSRLLESHDFEDTEEMQEFLNSEVVGRKIPDIPARTPLERAQQLMYDAFEASGRKELKLIREALAICPDCADAYVLLAERCSDPQEALEYYKQGVAAGERALGKECFEKDAGHFWGIHKTRPYMRARFGVAECLGSLGDCEDAAEHFREMLRLNPGDNQGVREQLAPILMRLDRDEEARNLLERYKNEVLAMWCYTKALLDFRKHGDTPTSRKALKKAIRTNRYVADYLLGDNESIIPEMYSHGSREEAVHCTLLLQDVWHETEGAIEWFESMV